MPGAAWLFAAGTLFGWGTPLDLVPLPEGFGLLGPLPWGAYQGRDTVVIAPEGCQTSVFTIDADGGPYARDARIARVWTGEAWKFADDWRVTDGQLHRPGRSAVPVGSVPERIETDAAGRVERRTKAGRTLQILRNKAGDFAGMAVGNTRVELQYGPTGRISGAAGPSGLVTTYTVENGRIVAGSRAGAITHYGFEGGRLQSILWADGALLRIESDGTSGLGGRWRCRTDATGGQITGPSSEVWRFRQSGVQRTTTGPSGAQVETYWKKGALTGWKDPRGRRVEVERQADGRLTRVRQDGRDRLSVEWNSGFPSSWRIDGQSWSVRRDQGGGVVSRTGPDGRSIVREVDALGLPVRVVAGSETWGVGRDLSGRPTVLRAGATGEVRIERDGGGRISRVFDASGGEWKLGRGSRSRVESITDPAGSRWELRWDNIDRLTGIASPETRKISVNWQGIAVSQVVVGSSARWSFLRDTASKISGFRTPTGRLWGFVRDGAGRIVQVRRPEGSTVAITRDGAGTLSRLGGVEVRRSDTGLVTELASGKSRLASWRRDSAARVVHVQSGAIDFGLERDGTGGVSAVVVGSERLVLQRDLAGRVVVAGSARLDRNSAGRITALHHLDNSLKVGRDLRGRVDRVSLGEWVWRVGRDALGRIATLAGPGGLEVGANWDPGGALAMIRLDGGLLVRRNTSADAGEVLAFDAGGSEIGVAGWSFDEEGQLESLRAGSNYRLVRDGNGVLVAVTDENTSWTRSNDHVGGWDGLDVSKRAEGWEVRVQPEGDRVWGLDAGVALVRRGEDAAITGLDGSAGGTTLVHDPLGRLVAYTSGDRSVVLERDGFGRLSRVGGEVVHGWDGLLRWGEQTRAPIANEAVARPGGVLMFDPRGFPILLPWVGALRAWPTGFVPGIETAELGPGERVAIAPGGPFLSLDNATDPLTGQITAGPAVFPWALEQPEPPAALSPWASPDDASQPRWDPAGWEATDGWSKLMETIVQLELVPGGAAESDGVPGLPWLPPSMAGSVPPPLAGTGGALLEEDPVDAYVLERALAAAPMTLEHLFRALLGDDLAAELWVAPELGPPLPSFLAAPLASEPFGH